jgi:hypothetical protein
LKIKTRTSIKIMTNQRSFASALLAPRCLACWIIAVLGTIETTRQWLLNEQVVAVPADVITLQALFEERDLLFQFEHASLRAG